MKAVAVSLVAIALLAACGGSSATAPAGSISVTMTEYKFNPSTISASSGKVVFFLINAGTVQHDMVISDSSGAKVAGSDLVSAGDTFVFTVSNIPAGTYTYFCSQPGHKDAGMTGTLTIT
jgi:plastocyanin